MRFLSIIALMFAFAGTATAGSTGSTFAYDLSLKGSTYRLKMAMLFDPRVISFRSVTEALNDANLMNSVSKTISEGWIDGTEGTAYNAKFNWNLRLTNFLVFKSHLITRCISRYNATATDWYRKCDLDTKVADGGKSMKWKFDIIHCQENTEAIRCDFDIQGTPKDMKISLQKAGEGLTIVRAAKLAFEGKRQAIENFAKIFFYLGDLSTSAEEAIRQYETSSISKRLNQDIDGGLAKYKQGNWSEKLNFRAGAKYTRQQ